MASSGSSSSLQRVSIDDVFAKDSSGTGQSSGMKWWQEAVVYQIYPRSFQDSNGDGVGDIPGIIERLDYLNDGTPDSLGVDAIWLSPIYPSPMFDFGYDISDYSSIDPVFGTMDDFKRLLKEAHKRNIKIIMDLVINHTSHLHPWFIESSSSRDNPKRDWYIWKDPHYDMTGRRVPPNNWLGMFGGKGWKWHEQTQQYYFHSFLSQQPDLNWRNPNVKEAVFHMIKEWLDLGVDGFRLDVINYIFKDDQFRKNPVQCLKLARPYDRQRHVYDRDRQPELSAFLSDLRKLLESYDGDRTSVGEIQVEDHTKVKHVGSCVGGSDQLHMAFNFAYFFTHWNAEEFRKRIQEWDSACQLQAPEGGWPTYTLSNHDYKRHISRFTPLASKIFGQGNEEVAISRAKLAALMVLTLRGTPFLYYGEEIGMRQEPVPRPHIVDPVGLRFWPFHPGRDGCRRPMAWNGDKTDGGGFTTATGKPTRDNAAEQPPPEQPFTTEKKPWLPLSRHLDAINVADQMKYPSSLLSFYKKCIWFRRQDQTLRKGDQHIMNEVQGIPKGVLAFVREYKTGKRLILLNFTNRKSTVSLSCQGFLLNAAGFEVLLSTASHRACTSSAAEDMDNSKTKPSLLESSKVVLYPNEGLVLRVLSKQR